MAGALNASTLDEKLDANGTSFQEAAAAAGYGAESHQVHDLFILRACPFGER